MTEVITKEGYKAPKILVLGVGGGGNNAINRMVESKEFQVSYVAVNTDKMVLANSKAHDTLVIGEKLTMGYGAGGDPEVGEESARENADEIEKLVKGYQMVILTGGMGGGTGTGAMPVIAKICQEQKVLSVAVVTKPFSFEGKKKMLIAQNGIERLREVVDTLLIIPNNKLLEMKDMTMDLEMAFWMADSVLKNTIDAITNIIFNCGTVNLDFNDLRTVLAKKGEGHLGTSTAYEGADVFKAVDAALHSPLLETTLKGASYVLVNCSGKCNLIELNAAIEYVQEEVGEDTYVMWGTVTPKDAGENIVVTIIATGLNSQEDSIENTKIVTKQPEVFKTKSAEEEIQLIIPDFLLPKKNDNHFTPNTI